MRAFLACAILATIWLLTIGSPLATQRAPSKIRWRSPEPILPMTFAHQDHVSENCLVCHHNYTDDTGNDECMACHVNNQEIWPLLEEQFHELCRSCHEDKQLAGENGGPTRRCIDCHVEESVP